MADVYQNRPARGKRNRTFTEDKMDWLTAGRRTPSSYFKIGFFLVQHLNGRFGKGWPSQELLAEICCTSLPTVKRAVKFFEDKGWLKVERKRTYDYKTRTWTTHNVYSLRRDNVQNGLDELTMIRRRRRLKRDTGDTSDGKGVTGDTLTPSNKKLRNRRLRSIKTSNLKLMHESEALSLHASCLLGAPPQRELPLKRVIGGGK